MEALLILAALAIILMFWVVKRYLIRRKAFKNRTAKPGLRKTESAPAAAENRSGDSGTVRPVIDRRQAGIADRRQHAVQEQTAAPATVAVREETPAALKEEAKIAEAPIQKPEPVAVKEEAPVAVEKAKAPTPKPAPSVGREELPVDWLPEDSVLRRHYLTQQQAEREALTNPYPTDSTLRRHYDAMVKIQMDGPSLQVSEAEVPTREESQRQNAASGQAAIHSLENEIASERESSSVATYDEIQAEAETETVNEAWLPEDSVLRRHYLTQLQAEREALTNPYPTDSTLRRHYDAMVKIQVDEPSLQVSEAEVPTREESRRQNAASGQAAIHSLENEIASERESSSVATYDEIQAEAETETVNEAWLPEDSVLRRHYLTQLQTDREALTNPYPTDSMLRRHYETMIRMQLDWPSAQESREQAPVPQERAVEVAASKPSVVQSSQPEAKAEPAMRNEAFVRVESKTGIPEDSILRRHFLSNLQTQIESELPDSPTDSVLKRHHDTLVCTKLAERLERMQG